MYYLKSRYYAPEICRFISADDISAMLDSPMSLWDKNLYVYCDNDPVNKKDDDGEIANFVAMGLLGAVVNVGVSFVVAKATGQDYGWRDVVIDATVGALTAIVPATKIGKVAKEVIKKGISMAGELVRTGLTKETVESIALSFFTPDVAKYGKLDFLNEKILKDKIQLTIINTPFEMAYSLVTSAGRQAQKSSRKTSSGRRTKTNNGYKVLRNRLVKRGRIAYHEMQYMYGGRIYYNRVYM